jgi:hypothetical protein
MSPLSGNAVVAHDQDYAVGQALAALQVKLAAALSVMNGVASLADSYNKIKALSDAIAPVAQPVIDAMNTYIEAGNNQP